MLAFATDASTISSLATGFGTLVLAIATFASVRSANRSTRVSELALLEQRRPVLVQSRLDDPAQKIMFVEGRWVRAEGGRGVALHDGSIYLAMSLRNVGSGIGVCLGWFVTTGLQTNFTAPDHAPEDKFRIQSRDLYIPGGDIGMWQGALRDRHDPSYQKIADAIDNTDRISIELLYSDQEGGQRTITRFGLSPYEEETESGETVTKWFAQVNRHWFLDRTGPRSDEEIAAATEAIMRARESGEESAREEAAAAGEAQSNGAPDDGTDGNGSGPGEREPEPAPVEIDRS